MGREADFHSMSAMGRKRTFVSSALNENCHLPLGAAARTAPGEAPNPTAAFEPGRCGDLSATQR